ncbi:glycerol kinase [Vibrio sp. JC009]|uniref:glycerol kinase n=1 Tax=Vibrio sp. JC009 TaxID=2912314 RepID=UPI0023B0ABA5|nr:glycerol kinase [Vibrio sp. JC009]WED23573.1 glycerol kinase [Vibrio sp. JC009]
MTEKVSTTALAKLKQTEPKALFSELAKFGYIVRHEDKWVLTDLGEKFGGEYVNHSKYGQFIVWPQNLLIDTAISAGKHYSATQLGEVLNLNAKKINQLLNELGWINREEDGWHITELGLKAGGEQKFSKNNESYYTVWHDTVLKNQNLKNSVREFQGTDSDSLSTDKSFSSFRQKFQAKHRTADGHYVRSKGELLIDNWLYMAGLVHAYERKLPIAEEVYSDFYLPAGKVYIQYWGTDTGPVSEKVKSEKTTVYQTHHLNLIQLDEQDIENLDEILPKELRKFGIKAH